MTTAPARPRPKDGPPARRTVHRAWVIAAVTFVTMLGAAGFRSVPGVLMDPLHMEFGWSHGTIGTAMALNMTLFGLMSPFAAALMDRFGIRPVVTSALIVVAAGSGLTVFMTESWQLLLFWGVLVGVGTGSMSMAFVATVSTRWFVARRGLVSGILTAANATGQLIFLPVIASLTTHHGWRPASVTVAVAALAVLPLVAAADARPPARPGPARVRRDRRRAGTAACSPRRIERRDGPTRARSRRPDDRSSGCSRRASRSAARRRTA